MSRMIDADALMLRLNDILLSKTPNDAPDPRLVHMQLFESAVCKGLRLAMDAVDAAPTVEPEPARVMTREEIESADGYVWFEMSGIAVMAVKLIRKRFVRETYEIYHVRDMDWLGYGEYWRCWTAQPTDEQREAAKWDG